MLTGWDADPVPDDQGRPITPSVCRGVALALEAGGAASPAPRLRALPADGEAPAGGASLAGLAGFLTAAGPAPWACPLAWGGRVELSGTVAAPEARA